MSGNKIGNLFSKIRNTRPDGDGSPDTTSDNNKPDSGNFLVVCPDFGEQLSKTLARTMYTKIMSACADRAAMPQGIDADAYTISVYDSYSPYKLGLVSLVVEAIIDRQERFYKVVRHDGYVLFEKYNPSGTEKADGIPHDVLELNFSKFHESRVIRLLLDVLELLMQAMSKKVAVSSAIIIKLYKLSELISNDGNRAALEEQISSIKKHLTDGDRAVIDSQSELGFIEYDSKETEAAIKFIFNMVSAITGGLPVSYLFGDVVGGLGNGDNGDAERENEAIKRYFLNVWSGICYSVWSKVFKYTDPKITIDDLTKLANLFETSTIFTKEAAAAIMSDQSGYPEEYFNLSHLGGDKPTPTTVTVTEEDNG